MQAGGPNQGGARCVADVFCGRCDERWRVARPACPGARRRVSVVCAPPAGEHAAGQVLGEQRVGEVVPPVAVDVQVAAQQPLPLEAQPLDQPLARAVLRADVGLQPVQPDRAEGVVADQGDGQRRHAPPGHLAVDPVAEVARPQRAADDVVDR